MSGDVVQAAVNNWNAAATVELVARAIDPVGWAWHDRAEPDHLALSQFLKNSLKAARAAISAFEAATGGGVREENARLREAILNIAKHHVATLVSARQELTDEDRACGNTDEWQDGFRAALDMVTKDYIEPLVAAHNTALAPNSGASP